MKIASKTGDFKPLPSDETWLLKRRKFDQDRRLFNPTLEMFDAAERMLYALGRACLSAYGIFED